MPRLVLALMPAVLSTLSVMLTSIPSRSQAPAKAAAQGSRPSTRPVRRADDRVAVVGAITIRENELLAELNRQLPLTFYHSRVPADRVAEFRAKALASLIEKALIFQDARARGIRPSEAAVREQFALALKKAGPAFSKLSAAEKAELFEQNRPLVVKRILLDRNEERFRASVPPITDKAVRAAYDARKPSFMSPVQAHLRHILVKVSPTATDGEIAALEKRVKAAHAEIVSGKPFVDVAKRYSEDIYAQRGGDLGFVSKGSFLQGAVDQAAFDLSDGELSEVVMTVYGFHIVERIATRAPRPLGFDEVAKSLRVELEAAARARAREVWLGELRRIYEPRVLQGSPAPAPAPTSAPTSRRAKR